MPRWLANRPRTSAQVTRTEYQKRYYRAHKDKILPRQRAIHLKSTYGLTLNEFDRLAAAQDYRCAICRALPRGRGKASKLHVDHDHRTDRVRSLLCQNCNVALGNMQDSPERLEAAAMYLRRFD